MTTKTSAAVVALLMTATVFVGVATALPPYWPVGEGPGSSGFGIRSLPGPFQVASDCNDPGARSLGYNGNSGNSSGTGYHTYSNTPGFAAGDYCVHVPGPEFVSCTLGTALGAIANFTTTYSASPLPATDGITAARRGLVTETENWALGQTCDGILGTGSDGEYEFGDLTAVLDVRDNGGVLSGTEGSDVKDCINPKAFNHHGGNTDIYVLDIIHGSNISFTVTGDWSRDASLSSGGTDENANPSSTQCGGDGVEPCTADQIAGGDHGGTIPDIESGRKSVIDIGPTGAIPDLVGNVTENPPTSSQRLAWNLEYFNGGNPLDWSFSATGGHFSVADVNNGCAPATLADIAATGHCAYKAGAAGFITVNIDGTIVSPLDYNLDNGDVNAGVTTNGGIAGWVWTAGTA